MAYTVGFGTTSEGITLDNENMTVLEGGIASETIIQGGVLRVKSGGEANSTYVSYGWDENDNVLRGSLCVESGGVAYCTSVDGGELLVSSSGKANMVSFNYGKLAVFSGGELHDAEIGMDYDGEGSLPVADIEGSANSTTIISGTLNLLDGANAYVVSVSYGKLFVNNGATASCISIGGGEDYDVEYGKGCAYVFGGGSANEIVVNYGTELFVSSGASVSAITENGGYVYVADGADVSFVENTFGDYEYSQWQSATVHAGTTANNIIVNGGIFEVFDGGNVNDLQFNYGVLTVSGGTLIGTVIGEEPEEDAPVVARIAGYANATTIETGNVTLEAGGTMTATFINGGRLTLENGATALRTSLGAGEDGDYYEEEGAYYGYAYIDVAAGAEVNGITVNGGGWLTVQDGGSADNIIVNAGGRITLENGATATNVYWTPCEGHLEVADGAVLTFAEEHSGVYYRGDDDVVNNVAELNYEGEEFAGQIFVMAGGLLEQMAFTGGNLTVSSGGTANGITQTGGNFVVFNGGVANEVRVNGEEDYYDEEYGSATMTVKDGGLAANTTVTGRGLFRLENGAVANNTTVGVTRVFNDDDDEGYGYDDYYYDDEEYPETASLEVAAGATANGVTVSQSGKLVVAEGGTATEVQENGGSVEIAEGANVSFRANTFGNIALTSGQFATVHAGTTANNITVNGGSIEFFNGGVANDLRFGYGTLLVSEGATMNNTVFGNPEDDDYSYYDDDDYSYYDDDDYSYYEGNGKGKQSYYYDDEGEGSVSVIEIAGTLNNTSIYNRTLTVNGGSADQTTLNGGFLTLENGATASGVTVNSGSFFLESGATGSDITVGGNWDEDDYDYYYDEEEGYRAQLIVFDDSSASAITIDRGGYVALDEGSSADNIVINDGGYLFVESGATATNVYWTPCEGTIYIEAGAVVTFAEEYSGVYYKPDDGESGASHAMTIWDYEFDGQMYVMAGGKVEKTTMSGGCLYVYDGGTVNDITYQGGAFTVYGGGVANGTIFYANEDYDEYDEGYPYPSKLVVCDGGTVNDTLVTSNAYLQLEGGAVANGATIKAGILNLEAGAVANDITVKADEEGEYGQDNTWDDDDNYVTYDYGYGYLNVSDGATANGVTVKAGGILTVSSGGVATNVSWTPCGGGRVSAMDGAVVTFADEVSGVYYGSEDILTSHAATMSFKSVGNNGEDEYPNDLMYVMSKGSVSRTTVNGGGTLHVIGGKADRTTVSLNGKMDVVSGGVANRTTVLGATWHYDDDGYWYYGSEEEEDLANGSMFVGEGGVANKTAVEDNGELTIAFGGVAKDTTLDGSYAYGQFWDDEGGYSERRAFASMSILSGGMAVDTEINEGIVFVSSGGVMSNVIMNNSQEADYASSSYHDDEMGFSGTYYTAGIHLSAGAMLTGQMTFVNEAKVFADNGAIIDFDLTQTTAGGDALLNDYSVIYGAPTLTLTVNGAQTSGTYRLIEGISVFSGTLAVISSGTQIGTLSVGRKITYGGLDYKLGITNDALSVTVQTAEAGSGEGGEVIAPVAGNPVVLSVTADITEPTSSDVLVTATFNADSVYKEYSFDGVNWGAYPGGILLSSNRTVFFRSIDAAGNASEVVGYEVTNIQKVSVEQPRIVEYSVDNFEHVLRFKVSSDALDSFRLAAGTYQSRTRLVDSTEWLTAEQPIVSRVENTPTLVKSDEDGNADVFFANSIGTWESKFAAQHTGSINDWAGTEERVFLFGKNKLADIFEGSSDANILLMTDDENGDALFVDDIFTAFPGSVTEQQARIARIDEIRAGFGDDIVDMTSQRFEYVGDGLTIRGGDGDDTIWANKGDNFLFGDAGDDRIVGASGNDVVVGGIGNDSMHGGGGDDVFAFSGNWGTDTVEQLASGSVTLWFASGSISNWDAESLTYTDGNNSVEVSGVSADQVTLKFGHDGSEQFVALSDAGAFDAFTSQRIFEGDNTGIIASL